MPITVAKWLVPQRVIYACGSGDITLEDMKNHNEYVLALMDTSPSEVHVVLDNSGSFHIVDTSLSAARDLLTFIRNPKVGWTVQVSSNNRFADMLATLLAKLLRARYRIADDFDSALAFLQEVDTSVDWSQVDMSIVVDENSINDH